SQLVGHLVNKQGIELTTKCPRGSPEGLKNGDMWNLHEGLLDFSLETIELVAQFNI
ncbi:hypothetical protein L9F63_016542, partial [Diploptera punctata]